MRIFLACVIAFDNTHQEYKELLAYGGKLLCLKSEKYFYALKTVCSGVTDSIIL